MRAALLKPFIIALVFLLTQRAYGSGGVVVRVTLDGAPLFHKSFFYSDQNADDLWKSLGNVHLFVDEGFLTTLDSYESRKTYRLDGHVIIECNAAGRIETDHVLFRIERYDDVPRAILDSQQLDRLLEYRWVLRTYASALPDLNESRYLTFLRLHYLELLFAVNISFCLVLFRYVRRKTTAT